MTDLPDQFDLSRHSWLTSAALQRLFTTIKAGSGEVRVVGGAVRDALLGRTVSEIDLAVNRTPDDVTKILNATGIKTVPTGIEHGTITAVIDHKGYEITTLRRDVDTDGRHATVAFTDDWQADAARRDFTMNALYVDASGKIYDYFDGRKDLAMGRVRFIGDANARIQEDVLRILRFFRFSTWFARGDVDPEGLKACHALAALVTGLSAERVWREMTKLLSAPKPAAIWVLMRDADVLAHLLPEASNIARLGSLQNIEAKYEAPPSPLVRLAALMPDDKTQAEKIAKRLKVSNREAEKLMTLATLPDLLAGKLDPIPFRHALYTYGVENARDAALLIAANNPAADIEPALSAAAAWEQPKFPIQGADLLKLGVAPGPKMGTILAATEKWWMERDFKPTQAECLAEAKKQI